MSSYKLEDPHHVSPWAFSLGTCALLVMFSRHLGIPIDLSSWAVFFLPRWTLSYPVQTEWKWFPCVLQGLSQVTSNSMNSCEQLHCPTKPPSAILLSFSTATGSGFFSILTELNCTVFFPILIQRRMHLELDRLLIGAIWKFTCPHPPVE